jgi:hypothetical protein
MLLLANQTFAQHSDGGRTELILFSDMRQSTAELGLESPSVVPDFVRRHKQSKFSVTSLRGVRVWSRSGWRESADYLLAEFARVLGPIFSRGRSRARVLFCLAGASLVPERGGSGTREVSG